MSPNGHAKWFWRHASDEHGGSRRGGLLVAAGIALALGLSVIVIVFKFGGTPVLEPTAPLDSPPGEPGGIAGRYFRDRDFDGDFVERVDGELSFEWDAEPIDGVAADDFGVEWKGFLGVEGEGSYRVCTISDDGVRLTLGGRKLIDNWTIHASERDCADFRAKSPGWYPLQVRFFEAGWSARISLSLAEPGQGERIVPADHLCCRDR